MKRNNVSPALALQSVQLTVPIQEHPSAPTVLRLDVPVGQITNDPLSGKSSVMSPMHDRVYRQLIMGTMVNVACEPSLYEELDGQASYT